MHERVHMHENLIFLDSMFVFCYVILRERINYYSTSNTTDFVHVLE